VVWREDGGIVGGHNHPGWQQGYTSVMRQGDNSGWHHGWGAKTDWGGDDTEPVRYNPTLAAHNIKISEEKIANGTATDMMGHTMFEGAASFSGEAASLKKCATCPDHLMRSQMAVVMKKEGYPFKVNKDETIRRVMEDDKKGKVLGTECVLIICYKCCENAHGISYTHPDNVEGKLRLTSKWTNNARNSKREVMTDNQRKRICDGLQRSVKNEESINYYETVQLMGNDMVRSSTDWVQQIGSKFMTVGYGCDCGFYPFKSGDFYRMCRSTDVNGTEEGQGYWVTACCLKKWK
jgi:hypothetical protein